MSESALRGYGTPVLEQAPTRLVLVSTGESAPELSERINKASRRHGAVSVSAERLEALCKKAEERLAGLKEGARIGSALLLRSPPLEKRYAAAKKNEWRKPEFNVAIARLRRERAGWRLEGVSTGSTRRLESEGDWASAALRSAPAVALEGALRSDSVSRSRLLGWIEHGWMGADEPIVDDESPWVGADTSALWLASFDGRQEELVRGLARLGASVNFAGPKGIAPLWAFAQRLQLGGAEPLRMLRVAQALLEAGADPLEPNDQGSVLADVLKGDDLKGPAAELLISACEARRERETLRSALGERGVKKGALRA